MPDVVIPDFQAIPLSQFNFNRYYNRLKHFYPMLTPLEALPYPCTEALVLERSKLGDHSIVRVILPALWLGEPPLCHSNTTLLGGEYDELKTKVFNSPAVLAIKEAVAFCHGREQKILFVVLHNRASDWAGHTMPAELESICEFLEMELGYCKVEPVEVSEADAKTGLDWNYPTIKIELDLEIAE